MTAPNSVETLFSPAGSSAAGCLPASRSSSAAGATRRRSGGGDSGGGSAAVKGREGAAVSDATAVEGRDDSPAVCGLEDASTAVDGLDEDSPAVVGRDDAPAVEGRDASRSVSPSVVV